MLRASINNAAICGSHMGQKWLQYKKKVSWKKYLHPLNFCTLQP